MPRSANTDTDVIVPEWADYPFAEVTTRRFEPEAVDPVGDRELGRGLVTRGGSASTSRTSSSTAARSGVGQHGHVAHRCDPLDHRLRRDQPARAGTARCAAARSRGGRVYALSLHSS